MSQASYEDDDDDDCEENAEHVELFLSFLILTSPELELHIEFVQTTINDIALVIAKDGKLHHSA